MILTFLAIGVVLLGFVALFIHLKKGRGYTGWDIVATCLLVVGGLSLIICLVSVGTRQISADVYIEKFNAVQKTLDVARANTQINPLELAALQQKAVEKNESLASMRFYKKRLITNWFYSNKILAIQPIR